MGHMQDGLGWQPRCGAAAASDRQTEQTELIDLVAPDGSLSPAGCDV